MRSESGGLSELIKRLLQRDLSSARQQPVDEYLRGVWMRRLVDQSDSAELLHQPAALFESLGPEGLHRQALLLQHIDVAEKADGEYFPTASQSGPCR